MSTFETKEQVSAGGVVYRLRGGEAEVALISVGGQGRWQLPKGLVGRGEEHSICLLLRGNALTETARARLTLMRETNDGFRIAEEDLRLRGEGDLLGTKQSGVPGFRIARIEVHGKLIAAARDDAALILSRDPHLASPRGEALRHLLYLFERDEAIELLRAG